jgi:hypothetical protein
MPDARRFGRNEASHVPEAAQFLLISQSLASHSAPVVAALGAAQRPPPKRAAIVNAILVPFE